MNKEVKLNTLLDMSNADYHAEKGISRSGLATLAKSPYHYHEQYIKGVGKKEPTPQMLLGSTLHKLFLEPDTFNDEFAVAPTCSKVSKAGKEEHAKFNEENQGKTIIKAETLETAKRMIEKLNEQQNASLFLENADIEKSIFFKYKNTDVLCKIRPDIIKMTSDRLWVIDLKTTANASFKAFQSSALSGFYFLQMAMINHALKLIHPDCVISFAFLTVENQEPHGTRLFVVDEQAIEFGANQFDYLINIYKDCLEHDKWEGYEATTLTVPNYASLI